MENIEQNLMCHLVSFSKFYLLIVICGSFFLSSSLLCIFLHSILCFPILLIHRAVVLAFALRLRAWLHDTRCLSVFKFNRLSESNAYHRATF